jgi:type I restriction enzyme, S subunit
MIAGLKPYPQYEESELPWLGHVPKHWRVVRNGSLFGQRNQTGYAELPILEVSLRTGVRVRDFVNSARKQIMSDAGKYKRAVKGDLAYNMMRMWQGAVGVAPVDGLVSPAYVVARPFPNVESQYYTDLFRTDAYMGEIDCYSQGIVKDRNRLYWDRFKQMLSPCPPPTEQVAIVRFLTWSSGQLRRAIWAKRKAIALLNEQKQTVIHRAVTRGLDSSVPLRPSGISWLGDIPQHWDARQLRHMGRLHKGVGGSKEDATPDGVPCVRYGELYFHFRTFIRQPRGFVSAERAAAYMPIRFGDVLFATSGERVEEIGKSAVNLYEGQAVCGGDVVIFRPTTTVHAAFLGYALDSYGAAHQKATMCRGTTIKHIYPDELRGLWTCVPPVSEQEQIATSLDSALLGCNTAISRLEREIELLREYRARLIANVVTGRLDVREAAARLPAETSPGTENEPADFGDETESAGEEAAA